MDVGDQALMRQEKKDKLTTTFNQVPYTVGTHNKRNTTFVIKFFSENVNDSPVEWEYQAETEPVK